LKDLSKTSTTKGLNVLMKHIWTCGMKRNTSQRKSCARKELIGIFNQAKSENFKERFNAGNLRPQGNGLDFKQNQNRRDWGRDCENSDRLGCFFIVECESVVEID